MRNKIVEMDLMKQNSTSSHCRIKFQKKLITKNRRNYESDGGCASTQRVEQQNSSKFFGSHQRQLRNKAGERIEQTTYFDCAYWLSPKVAQILTKGTVVELTGRVSARAWTGSDGQPHTGLNFYTSQIKLHGGGKKSETVQASTGTNNNKEKDDLPF